MEASKLTIDPEHLRFKKLPLKKRAELRKRNVIDLIRSKPIGTPIANYEFQTVMATRGSGHTSLILKKMLEKGVITRVPADGKSGSSYVVNADVKTKPKQIDTPPQVEPQEITATPTDFKTLEDYAKDFSWKQGSDSLREFVTYMEKVELDLRRLLSGGVLLSRLYG
jgi:hypothetical protein